MAVYGRILRSPGIALLITATTVTRLPFAINGLAIIIFLREETGSFGTAGLVAGMLALGAGVGAPAAARLVDHRGARTLIPLAFTHAAAILLLWALGEAGAPTVALVAAAIVAGAAFPPSGSVLRSRWPELLREDPELVRGAYALDSVTIELSFVSGPLITAAIVAALEPQAALGLSAVLVVAGTLLFVMRLPGSHAPAPHGAGRGWGPLRDPAIRLIALTTIPIGFCIGAVEVAVPAFSREIGETALAGVLLALWSVGSGIGGLVFGARQNRRDLLDTFLLMTVIFPLASLPLVAASSPLAMGALVLLAGAPIAPLIATRNELIGTAMPAGTGTEAFTWLITALVAGLALGNAIAGAVIESSGWPEAVLVGVGVGVLGAAGSVAGRRTLRPALAPV